MHLARVVGVQECRKYPFGTVLEAKASLTPQHLDDDQPDEAHQNMNSLFKRLQFQSEPYYRLVFRYVENLEV